MRLMQRGVPTSVVRLRDANAPSLLFSESRRLIQRAHDPAHEAAGPCAAWARLVLVHALLFTSIACHTDTIVSPSSSARVSPASSGLPVAAITFNGLASLPCAALNSSSIPSCSVTTYSESGFTVSTVSGTWGARTDYGNPAPFIQFSATSGASNLGELRIVASNGSPFYFESLDLYSSTTRIPYTVTGLRNSVAVVTLADTVPNTFGDFVTVANPSPSTVIDTLSIRLTNAPPAACASFTGPCSNPMGVDTIVLTTAPPMPPNTALALSGQITDGTTRAGIPNATVSIWGGVGGDRTTTTDGSGHFSVDGLEAASLLVTVSATNYHSDTKELELTSNQSLSFQLSPALPPPVTPSPPPGGTVISFGGLTTPNAPITSYSESGFTIKTVSGNWFASTTGGNPAPSIQFNAAAGATVTGEVQLNASGATFGFQSVDLYSSTTIIPYIITGARNSVSVFTLSGTVPNTFGTFKTVPNPNPGAIIDTLTITLVNAATVPNPMGLDNIVLTP